jgi:hypothetical protein
MSERELSETLTSEAMVEAVVEAIRTEQITGRVEYARRVGRQGRLSLARHALDVVCQELGVPDSIDRMLPHECPTDPG